ncbi:CRISPR-associated endonuclease Cas1 [Heliophilum fasciatum]|uniref:CRISPR-associated endonuclease Cas1 n=1 Tax=Heliophilum fasciatum TaxID=35700 RepID=A0A4R2RRE3_9FIRM|nr:CRISPR-associated endonuclease Cas1 [Heliophilum fasciatum]MCW2279018.1 CRISPR-associated protein Cas1 [Heliophilum fasciatum]TCP61745.1 CRISPR-associated Cas1 family protein [Heliophilum fasciatum]
MPIDLDLQMIIDEAGETGKKHLLINSFGSSVGKKSERLVVKEKGQVTEEYPFFQIEQITAMSSGVSLSTDVIEECVKHGIVINLLDFRGIPYATMFTPGVLATVKTRREQLQAYRDERSVMLAKAFVTGKMRNQINGLKYFAKYRKTARREVYDMITNVCAAMEKTVDELKTIEGTMIDDIRGQLLSVEGRTAHAYWEGVKYLLGDKVSFPGRINRGATDPVNSLLNYGYAVLEARVQAAILQSGLDPYGGFMHVDRPGKMSLVYDLIEEFRQPVVDRVVIALVTQGTAMDMAGELLADTTKRLLVERIEERLNSTERFDRKKFPLRAIILRQARRMAAFLRGENTYKPFVCSW